MPWPSLQHRTRPALREKSPPSAGGRKAENTETLCHDSIHILYALSCFECSSSDISNTCSRLLSVIVASLRGGRIICRDPVGLSRVKIQDNA